MNPIRLIFGVALLSLCVFGLPEGCLVLAHDATAPTTPAVTHAEPCAPPPMAWVGGLP